MCLVNDPSSPLTRTIACTLLYPRGTGVVVAPVKVARLLSAFLPHVLMIFIISMCVYFIGIAPHL
jgi:hypothetical protein